MTTHTAVRVLVTSEQPSAAGAIAARLEAFGLRTITAAGLQAARDAVLSHAVEAVVVVAPGDDALNAVDIAQAVRQAAAPKTLALVGVIDDTADITPSPDGFDALIHPPAHAAQLAGRLHALIRLAVMEDEVVMRAQTLRRRGDAVRFDLTADNTRPVHALYVGTQHPAFLAIHRAMTETGGELVAAQGAFSAFDYLHCSDFDAVVVNAVDSFDRAMTICSALRRNTRLFHVPALLLMEPNDVENAEAAVSRGASDIISTDAGLDDIARRVAGFAGERRRRNALRGAFEATRTPAITDGETGLATAHFFVDHLQSMADRASVTGRELAVVILRAEAPAEATHKRRVAALRQFGSMVRHLVRVEDLCARLSANVFAVALPATDMAGARSAAERLEAVGECTAFESDDVDTPFQMRITATAADLWPQETGRAFIARAIAAGPRSAKAG